MTAMDDALDRSILASNPEVDQREYLGRRVRETWIAWAEEQPDPKPSEEWRSVSGFEGLYDVNDHGRVRSLPRKGTCGGIRAPSPHPEDGHLSLDLWSNNSPVKRYVHQLVATAFIGRCPPGMEVRHLDGNPANNTPGNLAYGTSGENKQDMLRHGTNVNATKTHCSQDHEYTPENTYVDPDGHRGCRQCRTDSDLRRRPHQLAARRAATATKRQATGIPGTNHG